MYFTFIHRDREVEFGPYRNAESARVAFQRAYGYWPGEVVDMVPYHPRA